MDELRKALDNRSKSQIPEQLVLVTVKEVDQDKLTCTCYIEKDEIEIYDVSLTPVVDQEASEVTIIPAVGSYALMAIVNNDIRETYLVTCQKADKVIIRGGAYGGLVKVKELRDELNKTTQLLHAVVNTINGTPVPEPGSGSPSALQARLKAAISGKELGKWDNIENEEVTHG